MNSLSSRASSSLADSVLWLEEKDSLEEERRYWLQDGCEGDSPMSFSLSADSVVSLSEAPSPWELSPSCSFGGSVSRGEEADGSVPKSISEPTGTSGASMAWAGCRGGRQVGRLVDWAPRSVSGSPPSTCELLGSCWPPGVYPLRQLTWP